MFLLKGFRELQGFTSFVEDDGCLGAISKTITLLVSISVSFELGLSVVSVQGGY